MKRIISENKVSMRLGVPEEGTGDIVMKEVSVTITIKQEDTVRPQLESKYSTEMVAKFLLPIYIWKKLKSEPELYHTYGEGHFSGALKRTVSVEGTVGQLADRLRVIFDDYRRCFMRDEAEKVIFFYTSSDSGENKSKWDNSEMGFKTHIDFKYFVGFRKSTHRDKFNYYNTEMRSLDREDFGNFTIVPYSKEKEEVLNYVQKEFNKLSERLDELKIFNGYKNEKELHLDNLVLNKNQILLEE